MTRVLAWLLILVGLAIAGVGLALVLMEIKELYAHVLDDALATPEVDEKDRSRRILFRVGLAALGMPPLLAGTIMHHRAKIRRRHAKKGC